MSLLVIIGLLFLSGAAMGWVAFIQLQSVKQQLNRLEQALNNTLAEPRQSAQQNLPTPDEPPAIKPETAKLKPVPPPIEEGELISVHLFLCLRPALQAMCGKGLRTSHHL